MSSRLLQAAPSAPNDTQIPRARISGNRCDARAQLQVGSGAVKHLDVPLGKQSPARPPSPRRNARHTAARWPDRCQRGIRGWRSHQTGGERSRPRLDSQKRGYERARPRFRKERRPPRADSRVHDTANRGANAARRRPPAAPSQRFFSARLSSIDVSVCSRIRAGTSLVCVHHALADGRPQSDIGHRFEHDVGAVDGFHGQHARSCPRAAARRTRAG